MAILDIFKKKKSAKGKSIQASPSKVEQKEEKKAEKVAEVKTSKEKKIDLAWAILRTAHITEKATDLTAKNQYIFNIFKNANKKQIKDSIEDIYGVNVISVNIINIHGKKKRMGRRQGWQPGYKKAIVKIREGQKIELMPR